MKLPNHAQAIVPPAKLTDYLLSPTHRHGGNKARVFTAYGFSTGQWEMLRIALLRHAGEHEGTKTEDTSFGTRYTVEGTMVAPDGRALLIRSVWFIEPGDARPRFVTAYPLERSRK